MDLNIIIYAYTPLAFEVLREHYDETKKYKSFKYQKVGVSYSLEQELNEEGQTLNILVKGIKNVMDYRFFERNIKKCMKKKEVNKEEWGVKYVK